MQIYSECRHIDVALKSLWHPFKALQSEMDTFAPRTLAEYDTERRMLIDKFRQMNPLQPDENIANFVDPLISFAASTKAQYSMRFSDPFMTQYVMVVILSHALCEAAINEILALGLTQAGSHELFSILEKADIKEKWRVGPKTISSDYELKPGTAIFETLNHLTKQRNVFVHNKARIYVGDKERLEDKNFKRLTFQENIRWMRRFFSLPYDLSEQAIVQLKGFAFPILSDRSPITKDEAH